MFYSIMNGCRLMMKLCNMDWSLQQACTLYYLLYKL